MANREHLFRAVVSVKCEGGQKFFKFMFGQQMPVLIRFAPLERVVAETPEGGLEDGTASEIAAQRWKWAFSVDYFLHVSWKEVPGVEIGSLSVIDGCFYLGDRLIASDLSEKPLGEFLDALPAKVRQAPRAARRRSEHHTADTTRDDTADTQRKIRRASRKDFTKKTVL